MTYLTAEARQRLLDDLALAIEELALALAVLGAAYELLDERTADRLEEELFRGVQTAFGRAQRTHAAFAARYSLTGRSFAQPSPGLPQASPPPQPFSTPTPLPAPGRGRGLGPDSCARPTPTN